MEGTLLYVATKVVRAKQMDQLTFHETVRPFTTPIVLNSDGTGIRGFFVQYPDGYQSWSPEKAFLDSHRLMTPGEWVLVHNTSGVVDQAPPPVEAFRERFGDGPGQDKGPFADEIGG